MTRRLLLVLAVVVFVTTGGEVAWGFWTGAGTGTGSASTGSLTPPTPVTATAPSGSEIVTINWTASARATGYVVNRVTTSDGSTAPACGTTQSTPTTATTCTDPNVADGTYHYLVTAISASWTATGSSADLTVHNARPTVTVNQTAGQADPSATSPISFTAVFSEAVTGFTGADVTVVPATATVVVSGSGSGPTYHLAVSGLTSSSSVSVSIAADTVRDSGGAGNTASTSTDNTVVYDSTAPTAAAPTIAATRAFGNFVGNAAVMLTDAAADDFTGVASVAYYRCDGSTGSCTAANWTALGSSTATDFAITKNAPFAADGAYRIVAVATDAAGNISGPSPATAVTVDTTPPTVVPPTVNGRS